MNDQSVRVAPQNFRGAHSIRFSWAAAFLAMLLPWGDACAAPSNGPVRIFDTHGSTNESEWTVVSGTPPGLNPRHIVLDNGRIRIAHPPSASTERAGHLLYVLGGGGWRFAGDAEFGDWTYTGSSFTDPATNFAILQNTPDVVRLRFSFDFHRNEYENNASMPVQKTIVLHRCSYGYRAILDVPNSLPGEREVGFGGTDTHLFSFANSKGILWNPYQPPPPPPDSDGTDYEWLRDEGQPTGDWYAVSLAFNRSFYRMVSLRTTNPSGLRTGQFTGGHTGHLIHWAYEGLSRYEAFISAVPWEGTMARRVTVQNGKATMHAPKAGTYTLYTRSVSGRRHTYTPAKSGLVLSAGYNTVNVKGIPLYAPILVPVSNGVNFPADISKLYRAGKFD
jgi:hypothetical protein